MSASANSVCQNNVYFIDEISIFISICQLRNGNIYLYRLTMLQGAFCVRRYVLGCTHNIRRCIPASLESSAMIKRSAPYGNERGQNRETGKRRRERKRNAKRCAWIFEAVAFSRTVNQVLTSDQIDRLVLSTRKNGASGLRFLFVGVSGSSSSFFLFANFYCYPRSFGASSRYFDCLFVDRPVTSRGDRLPPVHTG